MKKIFSLFLAFALTMGLSATVFATDITSAGGSGSTSINLYQEATTFIVNVPTALPISMDENGTVVTSNHVYITNNSYGSVRINNVRVTTANGWSLVPYSTDFKSQKVGLKQFGLTLNGDAVATDGSISMTDSRWPTIHGYDWLPLSYSAIVAAQSSVINGATIASVVITIGWDMEGSHDYVLATDSDFECHGDGPFIYTGSEEYVEVPAEIQGVMLTSIDGMFAYNEYIKGVKLPDNGVLTSMVGTFGYSTIETVEGIPDTVIYLSSAFEGCENLITAPALPSSVNDISYMFFSCTNLKKAPEIPVSVSYMEYTFAECYSLTGIIWIYANPSLFEGFFEKASLNSDADLTVMGPTEQYVQILATRSPGSHIHPPI